MTLVLWPALRYAGVRLHWRFDLRNPAVRQVGRLSGWTLGYVVANQVAFFTMVVLANGVDGVTAYATAYIFFQLPYGLWAVSVMTAFTPEMAAAAVADDLARLRARFTYGLRLILVLMLPAGGRDRPAGGPGGRAGARARRPRRRLGRHHRRHPRRLRRGPAVLLGLPVRHAGLLRPAQHPHAVLDQRGRERPHHRAGHRPGRPVRRPGARRGVLRGLRRVLRSWRSSCCNAGSARGSTDGPSRACCAWWPRPSSWVRSSRRCSLVGTSVGRRRARRDRRHGRLRR